MLPYKSFLPLFLGAVALCCFGKDTTHNDLVGTWHATSESRDRLPRQFNRGSLTLILDAEGTFEAHELPGDMIYMDQPQRDRLVSGSGRWNFGEKGRDQVVILDFLNLNAEGEDFVPYRLQMLVSARRRKANICYIRGDPDDWNLLCFEKKAPLE